MCCTINRMMKRNKLKSQGKIVRVFSLDLETFKEFAVRRLRGKAFQRDGA
jgi:hypothetical protein